LENDLDICHDEIINRMHSYSLTSFPSNNYYLINISTSLLPPSGITLHSVFGQSQTFQILIKHIGKNINNYEIKQMQYENIFYDNSNDVYFII
jgi:hypothetical protein